MVPGLWPQDLVPTIRRRGPQCRKGGIECVETKQRLERMPRTWVISSFPRLFYAASIAGRDPSYAGLAASEVATEGVRYLRHSMACSDVFEWIPRTEALGRNWTGRGRKPRALGWRLAIFILVEGPVIDMVFYLIAPFKDL